MMRHQFNSTVVLLLVALCSALLWSSRQTWAQYINNQAATPAESYARGAADIISSKGMANVANSEAAINYEQARSANMDNQMKWTDTYFGMREKNKQYRDAERKPRASREDLYRWAKEGAPDRPTESELDPITGSIAWPRGLKISVFDDDRAKLDELFKKRAQTGGNADLDTVNDIRKTSSEMESTLKDHIRDMSSSDYITAKTFLTSLNYEGGF